MLLVSQESPEQLKGSVRYAEQGKLENTQNIEGPSSGLGTTTVTDFWIKAVLKLGVVTPHNNQQQVLPYRKPNTFIRLFCVKCVQ